MVCGPTIFSSVQSARQDDGSARVAKVAAAPFSTSPVPDAQAVC
jgi:hypothetical protein